LSFVVGVELGQVSDVTAIAVVVAAVATRLGRSAPQVSRVAVSDRLWASFLLRLQAALPAARFELASAVTRQLRMAKDEDEIASLWSRERTFDPGLSREAAQARLGEWKRAVERARDWARET